MSTRYFAAPATAAPPADAEAVRPLTQLGLVLFTGPRGAGEWPLMTDEAKLLTALDRLLADGAELEADVRPNGNPDVYSSGPEGLPAYPVLRRSADGVLVDFEQVIRPTPMGRVAALSLSLGTNRYVTFNPDHPVNLATRAVAARHPVVVAAGNEGADRKRQRETLSAWAQPPWVISVTATEDRQGTSVSPRSSIGDPTDPTTWPTVMSYGVAQRDPTQFGTSFAAPRVARQLAFLSAFLDIVAAVAAGLSGHAGGAPLPVVHIADKGLDVKRAAPTIELSAVPLDGIDAERLKHALERAGARHRPGPRDRSLLLCALLKSSARRGNGKAHEVGHGYVDDDTTAARLRRFSEVDALAALGVVSGAATDASIVDPDLVAPLLDVLGQSLLLQGVDLDAFENPVEPRLVERPGEPQEGGTLRVQSIREA